MLRQSTDRVKSIAYPAVTNPSQAADHINRKWNSVIANVTIETGQMTSDELPSNAARGNCDLATGLSHRMLVICRSSQVP